MEKLVLVAAGLVVGFLISLTGMGGGAIMTPFLILYLKIPPVLAVGTDLVFASITKITGGLKHRQEKNVDFKSVLWLAVGSLPASTLTARYMINHQEDTRLIEDILPLVLGITLLIVGIIVAARTFRLLGPKEIIEVKMPEWWALILIGAFGGSLVGITSIGGGTVIMALFLLFFSIPLNKMVGLDVLHGALLATVTALTYALSGSVDWSIVLWLVIGSIPGAILGVIAIKKTDRRIVRIVISVLIVAAGIMMFFERGH